MESLITIIVVADHAYYAVLALKAHVVSCLLCLFSGLFIPSYFAFFLFPIFSYSFYHKILHNIYYVLLLSLKEKEINRIRSS